MQGMEALLMLVLGVGSKHCISCSATLHQTMHGDQACLPEKDFNCYPGEVTMWIRTASHCGGFFHCNAATQPCAAAAATISRRLDRTGRIALAPPNGQRSRQYRLLLRPKRSVERISALMVWAG